MWYKNYSTAHKVVNDEGDIHFITVPVWREKTFQLRFRSNWLWREDFKALLWFYNLSALGTFFYFRVSNAVNLTEGHFTMSSKEKKGKRFKLFIMQQYRRTNVKASKFKESLPGKKIITCVCLRTNEWTYVTLMFCFILSNSGLQAGGISSYLPTLNLHLILKRCLCWCYSCTEL